MTRPTLALVLFVFILAPLTARADDRLVRLYAPEVLIETGLVKFFTPRFSLKTQVKVELMDDPAGADVIFGDTGRAVFEGVGQVWHVDVFSVGHPGTEKLVAWLTSDVGKRTIFGFAPQGAALFSSASEVQVEVVTIAQSGDALIGHQVSLAKCTRCHAVDEQTRMSGIGSTPSFGVLRSLPDWEERFSAFYVLNPHPSFTQIDGLTEPFPEDRPSPIAPIELTVEEVEAVLAYVKAMASADLGQALQHQ